VAERQVTMHTTGTAIRSLVNYRFRVLPRAGAGALREAGLCQARRARWSRKAEAS
jgi:hypothetical protein